MAHILLICMWTAALSGWFLAWYFYHSGKANTLPDTGVILKTLVVSAIALFVGCLVHSFLQSAINSRIGL